MANDNESRHIDKSSGEDTGQSSGGHPPAQSPPHPGFYYTNPEDEIDLADIFGILFRRKWFILAGIVICLFLAVGATLLMPVKYKATTILEIGQIQGEDEYRLVEPPEAVSERLSGISKRIYRNPPFNQGVLFSVENDLQIKASRKEGGIIEVELEAPKDSMALKFLGKLNEGLIGDHQRILEVTRQTLKAEIDKAKSQKEKYKGQIASSRNRLETLKQEKKFLEKQVQSADQQMDQMLAIKTKANLRADEPVGQLLFSSEIQRVQAHKDRLMRRLLSGVPSEREDIIDNIQTLESELRISDNNLKMAEVKLQNIISTTVLLQPQFSAHPASPNLKLNTAMGMVSGFFVSILLAFMLEFWKRNKEKIKG